MSYWTYFEIARDGGETTDEIFHFIEAYAKKQGWHSDCLEHFNAALNGVGTVNKIYGDDLEKLGVALSSVFPRTWFGIKGFGEEFRDIWIREFRAGAVTFSNGPFAEAPEED